jgi:DNA polymerase-3 subunit alpha
MGFVTLEDIQGNIELVLFPRTWVSYQPLLSVGAIVLIEGKVDAQSTPPKILVDTVKTEFKMLVPVADAPQGPSASTPKPAPIKPTVSTTKPAPPKPVIAESATAYATSVGRDAILPYETDGMPPPPDNFPVGWDSEWQPSFEEASIASRPEPVSRTAPFGDANANSPTYTPPRDLVSPPLGGTEGGSERDPDLETDSTIASALGETNEANPVKMPGMDALPQNGGQTGPAVQPVALEPFHIPSLYVPLIHEEGNRDHPPQQITVLLRSTGDKERDKRRIKTLHGLLISFHGRDKFSFHIFENGQGHLIDFPNDTTRICPELIERLKRLMGEESWRVEEITFQ